MDASWKCPGNKEKWKSPVVEPFPLELTCNERYSKNRWKLQFSLLRSSWFCSAFDKNSSASFRHQTTSHDKQRTTTIMAADGSLFNRSITVHSSIHARLLANQFVYTPDTPLQIHGKGGQMVNFVLQNSRWVFVCIRTFKYYIHCFMCVVILPVVWFTKSSQWHKYRTCVLLVGVKYFWDILWNR